MAENQHTANGARDKQPVCMDVMEIEELTLPIFYGLTSLQIMMENNIDELDRELRMEVSSCVRHSVKGIKGDVDKLYEALCAYARKQPEREAELKKRIAADRQVEEEAVLAFQAIRGACSLLICAAENGTHQLDVEAYYFVSNAIHGQLDKIERHVAELKKMRGEND